jgi:hypothetical protein
MTWIATEGYGLYPLISDGDGMLLQVGTGALEAVGSATFVEGMAVKFQFGRRGVVVRDLGDVVEVTDERDDPPIGKRTFVTPVPRGPLTAYNLDAIVKAL